MLRNDLREECHAEMKHPSPSTLLPTRNGTGVRSIVFALEITGYRRTE